MTKVLVRQGLDRGQEDGCSERPDHTLFHAQNFFQDRNNTWSGFLEVDWGRQGTGW